MSLVKEVRLVNDAGGIISARPFPPSGLLYLVSAPGGCQLVARLDRGMWCLGIVRRRWWRIVLVALTDILHGIDGQRAETVLRHGGRIMIGLTPYRIELPRRMPYELFVIPFVLATVLLMMRSSFDHTSPVATPSASSPAAIPKRESLLTEAKDWMAKGETIQARATLYQAKLLYPGDLQVEAFLQQIEGRDSP